ncbi:MAG TPA: phenylalanine--tRNA ligase subunit beta [Solirubrobacteraceae bacterium]|jgi:phenylalanyl-tRNA synthetase beta chain|nr:phenylalanine--tRNA ligase subunit beta [Solirubrobacteraceae bacterium]
MRAPLPWLREYCDPDLDATGIEERLTMTGTYVEAIHVVGPPAVDNFVVGRVLTAEQHPDADRLKVCTVDLGDGSPATIVCGAPNVDGGQTVAVARPGAVMPDGTKLGQAKLRGVVSEGMILAASELELEPAGERSAGIIVLDELDAEWAPGTPLAEVLPIATEVLELEITPNRPDCLGIYGIARELHAATGAPLAEAPWVQDPGSTGELAAASVEVLCPDLCPRFTARAFENVTIGPSPVWLRARLTAAGQRPINNVVDITNYAMLLTGQPLHAFDLDRVAGRRLIVRRAAEGEQVETLDGQTRELDSEMVVIEDEQGPTSIAGVMGGARSEVAPDTTRVLLEVATWDGPNIHRTSWALGLRSEASSRFEKGLQPEQCLWAQAVASALMIELCGATLLDGTIDVGGEGPEPQTIELREKRVESILGMPVAVARQQEILSSLDFGAEPVAGGLSVSVPALRRDDVTREIDLIEEVARIDGLERLPATLPARRGAAGRLDHAQRVRRLAEDAMSGRGLYEIAGWSFTDPGVLDRLLLPADHPLRDVVTIENPLSEDLSIMRPTLLGSLLDVARHNVSHGAQEIAIFESGTVYRAAPDGGPYRTGAEEHHALGTLLAGPLTPRSWRGERLEADFFAAKALLEGLLGSLHVRWSVAAAEPGRWPFLHPGRAAAVAAHAGSGEAVTLGFLGEVHPLVAQTWDLPRSAAFALDLGKLAAVAPEATRFEPFGAYPVLRQDLAVTLPDTVAAGELVEVVLGAGGETLSGVEVFDLYSGEQVGAGRRSLALALTFRSLEATLTDEDVAPLRARIVAAVGEIGGELRG